MRGHKLTCLALGLALALVMALTAGQAMAASTTSASATATTTAAATHLSAETQALLSKIFSNPKAFIAVAIQFILGFALGYYAARIIKYLLALIGIIVLGSVLSVWSIGGSVTGFLHKLGFEAMKLWPVVQSFLATFGIMTIAPVTAGFILGAIAAFARK